MKVNVPKKLPAGIEMQCYACEARLATHVCRYQMEELMVQVCLCDDCMQRDTEDLMKNTVGIEKSSGSETKAYLAN